MPVLIGLHGRAGSGKDTSYGYIADWAHKNGFVPKRVAFADKLKHSAMLALGFVVSEPDAVVLANSLKTLGEITTCIPEQSVLYTIEGRKFLQLYGTESHRDLFGKDFWLDALLPHPVTARNRFGFDDTNARRLHDRFGTDVDFIVITDLRFENEAERILDLDGVIWEIKQPIDDGMDHPSEVRLPDHLIDATIHNDGTLDDLRDAVYAKMQESF